MVEFLMVLIFLMIIGSVIAIETRHTLSAIISVGAVGLLLSIAFLFMGAPDLAITQIVVEIICLVILIRATISSDLTVISGHRELFGIITAVALVLVLMVFGVRTFSEFPEFGVPVMERFTDAPSTTYLTTGLEESGAANLVMAILLDFRAYDTLGEATVLFSAILGALVVLRRRARKRSLETDKE